MIATRVTLLGAIAALLCGANLAGGQDWLQFRGPNTDRTTSGRGGSPPALKKSSASARPEPTDFDRGLKIAWQVDLPGRGPSSPIVVDGRVIVTASSGVRQDELHVLAFDAQDGHPLWERQFWATGRTLTHPQTANAAPTPASDGQRIFAFFSSNDLVALDLDGNLLWVRGLTQDFPRLGNDVGMASSLLVVGKRVIVQSESQGDALVAGIDTADGTTRWQLARD
ncbi:MAG TPA: PQQ-binding-like beta-propeller repeat protein, partial [Pirellulales bacterium]|nr:PQQ-binding-like beta-propeller repeat protein [Pirellulales bacterium]